MKIICIQQFLMTTNSNSPLILRNYLTLIITCWDPNLENLPDVDAPVIIYIFNLSLMRYHFQGVHTSKTTCFFVIFSYFKLLTALDFSSCHHHQDILTAWISFGSLSPSGILGITLNCIQCWGSSPRTLGNVEYPFIAITLRSTLIWSGCTC